MNARHLLCVIFEDGTALTKTENEISLPKKNNIHRMMNGTLKSTEIRHRTYAVHFSKDEKQFLVTFLLHGKFFSNSRPFIS